MRIKNTNTQRKSDIIFCIVFLAWPILQWLVMYWYNNIQFIALAFQRYDGETGKYYFFDAANLFTNFKNVLTDLTNPNGLLKYFGKGCVMYLTSGLLPVPIGYFIAYMIYKKVPLANTFKVIMFLPSILSSVVIIMYFKFFIDRALPAFITQAWGNQVPNLLFDDKYNFLIVNLYGFFFAMPGAIVINVATMARIPEEIIEYGKLEGVSMWQEFWLIVAPLIYSLIEVMSLGIFLGFFNVQGPLYTIYAENAPDNVVTFGYYMYTRIVGNNNAAANYGYTTAQSVLTTLVAIPIVFGTKALMDKFNPEAEY